MKLLFDQNLSHRLVSLLEDLFPNPVHVRQIGLHEADDLTIWNHAKTQRNRRRRHDRLIRARIYASFPNGYEPDVR